MQRHQLKKQYCQHCGEMTRHSRAVTAMGCGDLLMVIVTMGLWLPFRWLLLIPRFRCDKCGG